jgi:hypothetical protein
MASNSDPTPSNTLRARRGGRATEPCSRKALRTIRQTNCNANTCPPTSGVTASVLPSLRNLSSPWIQRADPASQCRSNEIRRHHVSDLWQPAENFMEGKSRN